MSNNVAEVAEVEQTAKYYGGTITVAGRNLITSLLTGETIQFTRVLVGTGAMPEGVEPIDMTALVEPVAEASTTFPVIENSVLTMTVEYRNDMNGGLKQGFWLREFGIFAKTENTDEILLYYATLGDSPQPVNAYVDNRIDIRRYPVTIALELDAEIQVTYDPGSFVTAAEAQTMLTGLVDRIEVARTIEITIPVDGWLDSDFEEGSPEAEWPYYIDIKNELVSAIHYPDMALDLKSINTAREAGLCPTIQAFDGFIRFWTMVLPQKEITGSVSLIDTFIGASVEGGSNYVLPAATSTTLGGIKVQKGSGLTVDNEGNLAIDAATEDETSDLYEDTTGIPSSGVILSVPYATEDTAGGVKIKEGSGLTIDDEGYLSVDSATDEEVEDVVEEIL